MNKTCLSTSVEEFNFPDGQPHIKVKEFLPALNCRIANSDDLVKVCLLLDVYSRAKKPLDLTILYVMGERMDRAISENEPNSCDVICKMLQTQADKMDGTITLLSPHSDVVHLNIQGCSDRTEDEMMTESVFYDKAVKNYLLFTGVSQQEVEYRTTEFTIVFPDKGAKARIGETPIMRWWPNANLVTMEKVRELSTGKINGIKISEGKPLKKCVILDDLCDGGATFIGASKALREAGAEQICLAVTKGVFSKGYDLPGIDYIATTNAYKEIEPGNNRFVHKYI